MLVYAHDGGPAPGGKWLPLLLRPGRFTNVIGMGGVPFYLPPAALKDMRRFVAREKKKGRVAEFVEWAP